MKFLFGLFATAGIYVASLAAPEYPRNVPGVCTEDYTVTQVNYSAFQIDSFLHITNPGSDRLLLVGISYNNFNFEETQSITYNGLPLSLIIRKASVDDAKSEIWGLINPPVGTYPVVVTFDAVLARAAIIGATTFYQIKQDSAVLDTASFAVQKFTVGHTNSPLTLNTDLGQWVFGVVTGEDSTFTFIPDSGQTELWEDTGIFDTHGAGTLKPSEALQTTINWIAEFDDHRSAVGVVINCGLPVTVEDSVRYIVSWIAPEVEVGMFPIAGYDVKILHQTDTIASSFTSTIKDTLFGTVFDELDTVYAIARTIDTQGQKSIWAKSPPFYVFAGVNPVGPVTVRIIYDTLPN